MLTHVVLLKPKAGIAEDEIVTALDYVQTLQQAIPGIVSIEVGKNLNNSNQGYTHGFVIRFVDTNVYKGYAPHPAHQPVSEELQRISQTIIDFDIEHSGK
ncbi:MAG: Dabb family protein [Chloroflexi bacterium]|nr:Dabb family protein [Ktedonobacteraceae bacterium]MBV9020929.1 Dabb family protein [Ktedonobacteraceae bacterium]MBV9706976.1 Dabb family protein [Chloroflexota bacterium]